MRIRKTTKKVLVRKSEITGRGVFAEEDIKKGEFIFRTGDNFSVFVFLNHSCRPNAELIKQDERALCDKLFALCNIKTGKEITFDYRKTRWSHYYDEIEEKTGCSCGKCK